MERFENQDPIRQGRGAGRGFGMGRGQQEDQEVFNTGSTPEQQENRRPSCRCGKRGGRGQRGLGKQSSLAQDQPRSVDPDRGQGPGRGFRRGNCRRLKDPGQANS